MRNLLNSFSTAQALVLGVVIVGCATAATITGHLAGSDLLTVFGFVSTGTVGVAGAHVGAKAALSVPGQPVVPPDPAAAGTVTPSPAPAVPAQAPTIGGPSA